MSKNVPLTIIQGDSYSLGGALNTMIPDFCVGDACSEIPLDLTDRTLKAQIRLTADNLCASYDFEIDITDAELGQFILFLPASVSETMRPGNYVWDMIVIDDNDTDKVSTAFFGAVTVSARVTKVV